MELHLASMENVSCWPLRKLCVGATDCYTGMLSMDYLIRRSKAWKEVDTFEIKGVRQWLQVATVKERECAEFLDRLKREMKSDYEKFKRWKNRGHGYFVLNKKMIDALLNKIQNKS